MLTPSFIFFIKAPHVAASMKEFSQTPTSDAKNSPTGSIAHTQADDEAARIQAIGKAYFIFYLLLSRDRVFYTFRH